MKNEIIERLRATECEWLELEDSMEIDQENRKPASSECPETIIELTERTRERTLRQLALIAWLSELLPKRQKDDLNPPDVFDSIEYISAQAKKLQKQILDAVASDVKQILDNVMFKASLLWLPRWIKDGETRFSTIITEIEALWEDENIPS
ncbi:MAG: hypothetical protein ACD_3C00228G0001 [uncultured bacterium (gcode 4)]|uniref:Uncharacterized protein n=1 Tax=uncultured bacterium (gcode 4) TaxID=1234023 RepID=K2F7Y5_9BACT|nr:MAG: hypothetical protein ACD_3C00228G0001 [uncultured bacterium (gcode 4)]